MSRELRMDAPIGRRKFLKRGAAATGLTAAALVSPGMVGVAAAHSGSFHLLVKADTSLFDLVDSANGGPFYVPGTIYTPDGGKVLGKFHCWGFFYDAGVNAVVSQEYDLAGRGKVMVQGVEDEGPRAVTGGTGAFRNVRGEMTGADLSAFPNFTVSFSLIAAG